MSAFKKIKSPHGQEESNIKQSRVHIQGHQPKCYERHRQRLLPHLQVQSGELLEITLNPDNWQTRFSIEYLCFYLTFEDYLWNHVSVSEPTRHYWLEDFLSSLAWHSSMNVFSLQALITLEVITRKIPALLTLPFLPSDCQVPTKHNLWNPLLKETISFLQRIIQTLCMKALTLAEF